MYVCGNKQTMIKANELRIGNLLNYDTPEGDVVTLTTDFNAIQWATEDPKCFNLVHSPIPLTEEWLVKFGFKQYIDFEIKTNIFFLLPLCGFSYDIATKQVTIFEMEEGNKISHCIKRKIEYVHTLQNLYFALRGQELTIK